jgi:hypothetical protein
MVEGDTPKCVAGLAITITAHIRFVLKIELSLIWKSKSIQEGTHSFLFKEVLV